MAKSATLLRIETYSIDKPISINHGFILDIWNRAGLNIDHGKIRSSNADFRYWYLNLYLWMQSAKPRHKSETSFLAPLNF